MGCVQSYFRKAHKAGLSPSSTQGSDNADLIAASPTDPAKQLLAEAPLVEDVITTSPVAVTSSPVAEHEVPNGHAPGTNGAPQTGLGLLGPGIAALAASTGTVAILGAAADTTMEAIGDVAQEIEDAKKEVDALAEKTKEGLLGVGTDLKKDVEILADNTKNKVEEAGQDIQKKGEALVDAAKETVEDAGKLADDSQKEVDSLLENAKGTLVGVGKDIQDEGQAVVDKAKDTLEGVGKVIQDESEAVVDKAKETLEGVGKDIQDEGKAVVDKAKDTLDGVGKVIQDEGEAVVDKAKETLEGVGKDIQDEGEAVVDKAKDTLEGVGKVIQDEGEAVVDKAKETLEDAEREVENAQKEMDTFVDKSKESMEEVGKDIRIEGEDLAEKVKEKVEEAGDFAESTQKSVETFVESTKEAIVDVGKDIQGEGEALVNEVKDTIEDVGKDVQKEGEALVDEVNDTIEDVGKDVEIVQKEVNTFVDKTKENIEEAGDDVQSEVVSITDKTKEALENVGKDVKEVEKMVESSVEAAAESIIQVPTDNVQSVVTSISEAVKSFEVNDESLPAPPSPILQICPAKLETEDIEEIISKSASIITDKESETGLRAKRSVSEPETTEDPQPTSASEPKGDTRPDSVVIVESVNPSRPLSIVENVMDIVTQSAPAVVDAKAESQVIEGFEKEVSSLLAEIEKEVSQESLNLETSLAKDVEESTESLGAAEIESGTDKDVDKSVNEVVDEIKAVDVNEDTKLPERTLSRAELVEEKAEEVVNEVVQTVTELVTKSATTIQATFRGHQSRLHNKNSGDTQTTPEPQVNGDVDIGATLDDTSAKVEKEDTAEVPEDIFPPPPDDSDSDILSGIGEKALSDTFTTDEAQSSSAEDKYNQQDIINVTINPDMNGGSPTSLDESGRVSEAKSDVLSTAPAESEPESLDAFLVDGNRAVSIVSESTASIGDSVGALKGSETDSIGGLSMGSEDVVASAAGVVNEEDRLGSAATKIQASYRGFHARQNLQQATDDTQLPVPEPLPLEEVAAAILDEDDLPPPPEECDIEPPPPLEIDDDRASVSTDHTDTPRSPETGEKLKTEVGDLSASPGTSVEDQATLDVEQLAQLQKPQVCDELPEHRGGNKENDVPESASSEDQARLEAELLAELQKPQVCDELPEHRGGNVVKGEGIEDIDSAVHEVLQLSQESVTTSDHKDDLVNGVSKDAASSNEVDDSSLSSAATKIQAGARGYLSRKLIKDTFSTTAPSITDSITDDGVHTSGSLETEVQRQSTEDQNAGVTAVVISNAAENGETVLENGTPKKVEEKSSTGKGLSLDSQLPEEKKKMKMTSATSLQNPDGGDGDHRAWETLQSGKEDAATKIQSNFRGYRTRQRLQRENAVQVPTSSSGTPATTISESSDYMPGVVRSSGEFHDMLVLPTSPVLPDANTLQDPSVRVPDDALAVRQTSTVGKRREGSDVTPPPPPTPASHTGGSGGVDARECIIEMGEAGAEGALQQQSEKRRQPCDMKAENAASAATKIQAGFRGYKVRKQMRDLKQPGVTKKNGPRRRRSSNTCGTQQVPPSLSRGQEMTLQDKSATTIQAGIRGFLVRKRRQEEKKAAVKIQAGFRGYQVRKDVKTRAPVEK